jgi:hypothetical protein
VSLDRRVSEDLGRWLMPAEGENPLLRSCLCLGTRSGRVIGEDLRRRARRPVGRCRQTLTQASCSEMVRPQAGALQQQRPLSFAIRALLVRWFESLGAYQVDVVVDLDAELVVAGSQDAADVLHDAAFGPDGEGQEERVQRRAVEAFAEQAGGGGEQEAAVRSGVGQSLSDRHPGFLAQAPPLVSPSIFQTGPSSPRHVDGDRPFRTAVVALPAPWPYTGRTTR